MNNQPSDFPWSSFFGQFSGLIGVLLGAWIVGRREARVRRMRSVYDIGNLFGEEANSWARRPFQVDSGQVDMHRASINHLSPNLTYLRLNHPALYRKVTPVWTAFSGGDHAPEKASYLPLADGTQRTKDYWVELLYRLADTLRSA